MSINNLTNPGMEPQAGDLVENTEAQTPEESVGFIMGQVVEERTKQMAGEESIETLQKRIREKSEEMSKSLRGKWQSCGSVHDLLDSASKKAGIVSQVAKGYATEHEAELREGFLSIAKTLEHHMSGLDSVGKQLADMLQKKAEADKELFDNE